MENTEKKLFGTIELEKEVDVTDPCYDKDVWCRCTVGNMIPGTYNCGAEIVDEGDWGKRVKLSWIVHESIEPEYPFKGLRMGETHLVGVDAGLLGYFNNKKNFNDAEWQEFCDAIKYEEHGQTGQWDGRDGFFTSSGYGDGEYRTVVWKKAGKNVAIVTYFI